MLEPETGYNVQIEGREHRIGGFGTGVETTTAITPVLESVALVGGEWHGLDLVCGEKVGIETRIERSPSPGALHVLVQVEVVDPDGHTARVLLPEWRSHAIGRWLGAPGYTGGCLGEREVSILDARTPVDVQVTLIDPSGNTSRTEVLEDVLPRPLPSADCPPERNLGCR